MQETLYYRTFTLAFLAAACGAVPNEAVDQTTQPLLGAWTQPHYPNATGGYSAISSLGTPAVSSWPKEPQIKSPQSLPSQIDVFSLGPNYPNHAKWTGPAGWSGGETDTHAVLRSNAAAVSWYQGRTDVIFVRYPSNSMWHTSYDSGQGWEDLGGVFDVPSQVAITSWGQGRLDLFGQANNQLYHQSYDGGWNTGWDGLGGSLASRGLAAISTRSGTIDVFAIWTDGQVYTLKFSNGSWGSWDSLGTPPGGVGQSTAAYSTHYNQLAASWVGIAGPAIVFAYDPLGNLYKRTAPYTLGWTMIDNSKTTAIASLSASRRSGNIELFALASGSSGSGIVRQNSIIQ